MSTLLESKLAGPKTLQQAVVHFADEQNCLNLLVASRWPNGMCCPRCGDLEVKLIQRKTRKQTRTIWKCKGCKKQFSIKVGTIFEDSPLSLSKWLVAAWLLFNAKNGISSCEVHRALGVTQKTAWFMLHRLREAIMDGAMEMFDGTIEADETGVGGIERNKHVHKKIPRKGRGGGNHNAGKSIVMGILERGDHIKKSRVKAEIIFNVMGTTLKPRIRKQVKEFANIYTDAHGGYRGLSDRYIHKFVDHVLLYALGEVHTNGIENFWSLLKRCLKGTYIAVEPFHLKRYIDEMVFRFNNRGGSDWDRFVLGLSMIEGKRLTFEELIKSYEAYYDQVLPRVEPIT